MKHEPLYPFSSEVRMLRLPEVMHRMGLGRSAIYAKIKQGEFPAPVHLGPRAVAWTSDAIRAFIDACIADTRGPEAAGRAHAKNRDRCNGNHGNRATEKHQTEDNVKVVH